MEENRRIEMKPERVVFRKWHTHGYGDGIIAMFPDWIVDELRGYVNSFEHVGQNGGADYAAVIQQTRPARPEEYRAIKAELETRGYTLNVYQGR